MVDLHIAFVGYSFLREEFTLIIYISTGKLLRDELFRLIIARVLTYFDIYWAMISPTSTHIPST